MKIKNKKKKIITIVVLIAGVSFVLTTFLPFLFFIL